MVGGQGQQDPVDEQDMLEVVDDALAVQKVHGGAEKVPVERLGEAQTAGLAGDVGDGDDLLEADDLHGGDDGDDVEVASAEGEEEAANHDERPCCADDEVCLFLLVLALFWDGWCLDMSAGGRVSPPGEGRGQRAHTADLSRAPLRVGLLGCEPDSLISDMLIDGRRARPLLALLCANLTSLRGRAMVDAAGAGREGRKNWRGRQRGATAGRRRAQERLVGGRRRGRGGVVVFLSGGLRPCKSTADQKRWRRHSARSSRLPALPPVAHVKPRRGHPGRTAGGHNARRVWQPCTANAWAMHVGSAIGTRERNRKRKRKSKRKSQRQRRCSNVRRRL